MSNAKHGHTGIHGIQMKQTLTCRVCGLTYLGHHLTKECDDCRFKPCGRPECLNRLPKSTKKVYCSTECKAADPMANKMPLEARVSDTCKCGKKFPRYENQSRHSYCSPECSKKYDRKGDRLRNDPELARKIASLPKPNHGLKGHRQTDEHLIKRLGTGALKPSVEELSLVPGLAKLGFTHTGGGTFWRRWPDGTIHNPDFINEETRTIVEYFGAYWHADDRGREDYIRDQWKALKYDCKIIWSEDKEAFLDDPSKWDL